MMDTKLVNLTLTGNEEQMGKGKGKNRSRLSAEQAAMLIMGVFGRNPRQVYNYKQISKLLFINDKQGKAMVSRSLEELVRRKQLEQVGT